jgi:hypothetical protein
VKQAIIAIVLLLPFTALAQPAQPPSRYEMQSLQNEMVQQLQAKLQLQAQVLDLTAKVEELQKQLATKDATPPAKKD